MLVGNLDKKVFLKFQSLFQQCRRLVINVTSKQIPRGNLPLVVRALTIYNGSLKV
jgi:hypothetical protein